MKSARPTGATLDDPDSPEPLNRRSYDAIARQWSHARIRLPRKDQQMLDRLCEGLGAGDRVLDLGCGNGHPIATRLDSKGVRVTGVDQSPRMLALARTLLPRQTWIHATIESFVPSGTFAAVICWDALFHISRERHEGIFRMVHGALPSGGRFLLTSAGSEHPAFEDVMFDHRFFYDSHGPETTRMLLQSAGFAIEHSEFLDPPGDGRDKGRLVILASAI